LTTDGRDVIGSWSPEAPEETTAARVPRQVAHEAIIAAVHEAARAELGQPHRSAGTASGGDGCGDPGDRRRYALQCLMIAHELTLGLDGWIADARACGSTWQNIGDAVGLSRQAVHGRYATGESIDGRRT
jgi:hypothetical protein